MSPCRPVPARPVHRRHSAPNPPKNAAAAQGVVPRHLEFRRNANTINSLQKSGVQVGFEIPPNPNAVMLPNGALLFRGDAVEVAALGLDNRVTLKKVNIARDLGAEVEITGGLGVGERVVAHPPDSI